MNFALKRLAGRVVALRESANGAAVEFGKAAFRPLRETATPCVGCFR